MTETTRQQKVARQIQKDTGDIFIREAAHLVRGVMVSVTGVRVSSDLSFAKIMVSVFPFSEHERVMKTLANNIWLIRKALGTRLRNQLKQVPEIAFGLDDSLEYIEKIDNLLK